MATAKQKGSAANSGKGKVKQKPTQLPPWPNDNASEGYRRPSSFSHMNMIGKRDRI
ncbi:hypothetical protein FRC01_005727, partial [Tulasnella sp. 417]